jgi:hypothetical protein
MGFLVVVGVLDWSGMDVWGSVDCLDDWLSDEGLGNNWLSNGDFVDEWLTLNLGVESVDWVSCVVNSALVTVSIDQRVVTLDNIAVS